MTLPVLTDDMSDDEIDAIVNKATTASGFLKAISHEGRLMILCLVVPRRDGKTIYYRLADDKPKRVLEVVYDLFCKDVNA